MMLPRVSWQRLREGARVCRSWVVVEGYEKEIWAGNGRLRSGFS